VVALDKSSRHHLPQTTRGYRTTIKSGTVTFEGGQWTGETPSGLVRGTTGLAS
jgi:hypothetical protein